MLALVRAAFPSLHAAEDEVAAVASKVSADYIRAKQPDGSFQVEAYAFGPGGHWAGNSADPSVDKLTFLDVSHVMAPALATQNYIPSFDPKATKLLIMVYWGTSRPPERFAASAGAHQAQEANAALSVAKGAAAGGGAGEQVALRDAERALDSAMQLISMENRVREIANVKTVKILGYESWWNATDLAMGAKRLRRDDLLNEIEEPRYFVVLMAYDFQLMWENKQTKLLWETRFSIRERHNEFDKQLAAMAQQAALFFGQDSHGLQHKPLPNVRVDLGESRVIGTEPPTK